MLDTLRARVPRFIVMFVTDDGGPCGPAAAVDAHDLEKTIMMAEQSDGIGRGVRRFLADLRALPDRRLWRERRQDDRRTAYAPAKPDLRRADRRTDTNRRVQPTDRRRRDNGTFLRVHVEIIREMIMDLGIDTTCPQCDGNLLLGPVIPHEGGTARQVHCTTCRRSVVMVTVPGQPVEFA